MGGRASNGTKPLSDLELALLTPPDLLQLFFQLLQASCTHLQRKNQNETILISISYQQLLP